MQSSEREEAGSEHTLRASWGPDLEDTGPGGDHLGAEQEGVAGPGGLEEGSHTKLSLQELKELFPLKPGPILEGVAGDRCGWDREGTDTLCPRLVGLGSRPACVPLSYLLATYLLTF